MKCGQNSKKGVAVLAGPTRNQIMGLLQL